MEVYLRAFGALPSEHMIVLSLLEGWSNRGQWPNILSNASKELDTMTKSLFFGSLSKSPNLKNDFIGSYSAGWA